MDIRTKTRNVTSSTGTQDLQKVNIYSELLINRLQLSYEFYHIHK